MKTFVRFYGDALCMRTFVRFYGDALCMRTVIRFYGSACLCTGQNLTWKLDMACAAT